MQKSFEGKVAFVAGGTRGMNLAIAKRYASHGAKVTVMSRSPERTKKAAQEIRDIGTEALGIPGDVRKYDVLEAAMQKTQEAFGKIDFVVAGQAGNFYALAKDLSANGFRTIIDIDLMGTFNVFRSAFPHLNTPGASLIAITAPEAVRPLHFQSHVCAAKAGVNMLCKCLAIEWGRYGVRINGISPGPVENSWGMMNAVPADPGLHDRMNKSLPLGHWATEENIADAAFFLSSDYASYVTGTVLEVDGGSAIIPPDSGKDLEETASLVRKAREAQLQKGNS